MKKIKWMKNMDEKKLTQVRVTSPHQGINSVLILKKLIPYLQNIYKVFKILIASWVGSWPGISCKWSQQVGYIIPGPWLLPGPFLNNQPTLVFAQGSYPQPTGFNFQSLPSAYWPWDEDIKSRRVHLQTLFLHDVAHNLSVCLPSNLSFIHLLVEPTRCCRPRHPLHPSIGSQGKEIPACLYAV